MFLFSEVTGVSPSNGGVLGGTLLSIHGRFFDETDHPAQVLVGGNYQFISRHLILFSIFILFRPTTSEALGRKAKESTGIRLTQLRLYLYVAWRQRASLTDRHSQEGNVPPSSRFCSACVVLCCFALFFSNLI